MNMIKSLENVFLQLVLLIFPFAIFILHSDLGRTLVFMGYCGLREDIALQ